MTILCDNYPREEACDFLQRKTLTTEERHKDPFTMSKHMCMSMDSMVRDLENGILE